MKSSIIHGIMVATIFIAGCGKESPSNSVTPQPARADATSSAPAAQLPERAIVTKAKSIVLPEFKLDRVTLTEALVQLQKASTQNDPENQGVNFMTNSEDAAAVPKITLDLKNITLEEATKRLAEAAGMSVSARDYAFVFDLKSGKP